MTAHKAHWYLLYHPNDEGIDAKKVYECFQSLSSLLCIEEDILLQMLTAGGLAQNSEKRGLTTNSFSWETFIHEFMLQIKISQFYIFKKWHLLIRIGSWDNRLHPKKNWRNMECFIEGWLESSMALHLITTERFCGQGWGNKHF
jgi:hypothetical protein